jgi:ElaB/YqjD/DUF883 family membrane-anchored ribosome-binding protein
MVSPVQPENIQKQGQDSGMHRTEEQFEKARENVEHLSSEIRDRAGRMASDATERAREYYDEASDWMKDNYGKTLAVVGILAAAGLIGYMLSRSTRSYERFRQM